MKKILSLLLLQMICMGALIAQPAGRQRIDESTLPGKRGELNVRNSMYPRLLPDNRMVFKVKAPDAKTVQIDLGRKYDLVRNAEGEWTGTTDPLTPGFHYYSLIIDGVSVADPASESFYGSGRMSSGVE
ncbi:MAG: esterase, partial [Prevotellaceae bacterium]|nr:esterase [Prevotellaceae bacterium]